MRDGGQDGQRRGDVKHLWRWLFSFAAGLSAVLCIASGILWVRSYWVGDQFAQGHHYHSPALVTQSTWFVRIGAGGFSIGHYWQDFPMPPSGRSMEPISGFFWNRVSPLYPIARTPSIWNHLGMAAIQETISVSSVGGTIRGAGIAMPFWLVCSITLACPGLWLFLRMRRRDSIPGHCVKCGYDLRATPDRCPECGRVVNAG
jgi:hypothetical protein